MIRTLHVALLVLSLTASTVSADSPKSTDARLGTWRQVLVVGDGKAPQLIGDGTNALATISDDGYTVTVNGKSYLKGKTKVDSTKSPTEIEIAYTEGPWAGGTVLGISKIEGDIMIECIGTKRPTEFKSVPGSTLMVWLRVK